jgi:hypothetical protein
MATSDGAGAVTIMRHCRTSWTMANPTLMLLIADITPCEGTTVRVNQTILGLNDRLRSDLPIINGVKSAAITDVTTPFKNRSVAFEVVRNEKRAKYYHTADQ